MFSLVCFGNPLQLLKSYKKKCFTKNKVPGLEIIELHKLYSSQSFAMRLNA